jgi:hypothetical protein
MRIPIFVKIPQSMTKKGVIQWENGLSGLGGYERIFSWVRVLEIREKIKKNPY